MVNWIKALNSRLRNFVSWVMWRHWEGTLRPSLWAGSYGFCCLEYSLFRIPAPQSRGVTDNRTKSWKKQEGCLCVCMCVCVSACTRAWAHMCMHTEAQVEGKYYKPKAKEKTWVEIQRHFEVDKRDLLSPQGQEKRRRVRKLPNKLCAPESLFQSLFCGNWKQDVSQNSSIDI